MVTYQYFMLDIQYFILCYHYFRFFFVLDISIDTPRNEIMTFFHFDLFHFTFAEFMRIEIKV